MSKKAVFLPLALLLPVVIFIFLKLFGKNKFDIPVYYQNGVDSVCVTNKSKPFQVDSIIFGSVGAGHRPTVVTYAPGAIETENLRHVWQEVDSTRVNAIFLPADSTHWRDCVLLMRSPWKTVLVDDKRQIRGYYALTSREETDRLIVELKILLEQY